MTTRVTAAAPEQKPGVRAHRDAIELAFPEVVERLRDWLGVRLVAYLGNVGSTRPVGDWAAGRRSPGAMDERRLRLAFQAAAIMLERYSSTTVQTWFQGGNPALRYEAPARVIRTQDPDDVTAEILAVASSFAYVG